MFCSVSPRFLALSDSSQYFNHTLPGHVSGRFVAYKNNIPVFNCSYILSVIELYSVSGSRQVLHDPTRSRQSHVVEQCYTPAYKSYKPDLYV